MRWLVTEESRHRGSKFTLLAGIDLENGIRNGSLTYREAATLREEQHRITRMIVRAREDGRVDPYERSEIERAQVQARAHIYREKHDAEVAPRRYGWWHRTGYDGHSRWW